MTESQTTTKQPIYIIVLLILAAEAVFILPFVLQRVFKPTFLETFAINNENLGYCFSFYGIVALFSYLFGGPLADKFQPKNLMAAALLLTAIGGLYFATFPEYSQLKYLYAYWGFTTIFLFWAAMIKATRIWGGSNKQGMAFGFLDGGRGLVAALFGTVGVFVFAFFIDVDISETTLEDRQNAFKYVILTSSAIVAFIGVLVFFFLKPNQDSNEVKPKKSQSFSSKLKSIFKFRTEKTTENKLLTISDFKIVLKYKAVWLLMVIILCAYVGYKATDFFTLYTKDVMGYDDIKSAKVGTYLLYMRPIIGVVIGLMADRTRASLWLIIGFILMLASSLVFASGIISEGDTLSFIISVIAIAIGVYSCRVLYFATLEEAKIPVALTGTTVGLVSIVGYTPDIFQGPMFGILLDNTDKVVGLQNAYLLLSVFSVIGLITSYLFFRTTKKH